MKNLIVKIDSIIFKVLKSVYRFVSYALIVAALSWAIMILIQVISIGRMPIESDPRFIKDTRFYIGIAGMITMIYGGGFWILFTIFAFFLKELKNYIYSFRIGLVGIILSSIMVYLINFSETGQWILD